jgi:Membrane protein involved in the export of O-antigen and teichoic acid
MTTAPTPQLGRTLAWSTVGSAAARIVGGVGGVLAARALTPTARGVFAVLVVLGAIGSIIGASGVQFWIAREVARTRSLALASAVAIRHAITVGALFIVAAVLAAPWCVGTWVSMATYVATAAAAITGAVALLILAIPNGARAMGIFGAAMTAGAAAYCGGIAVLLVVGGADVTSVMWCTVLGNVVSIVVVIACMQPHREASTVARRERVSGWRTGLRFGIAGGFGELVLFGMLRVDFLILAVFRPAAEVGAYAIATSLTELLWIVSDATAHVALPTAADQSETSAAAKLPAVFRIATTVGIIAAVVLSVIARPVIGFVFGTAYESGATAVPFLALAAVIGGGWKILSAEIIGGRGTRARLTSALGGMCVMVGVDLLLIPRWGIRGAGIGAAVGYLVAGALIVRVWRRESGRPVSDLVGLRAADVRTVFASDARPLEGIHA